MFRVDAEIGALPVTMSGKNMKRFINRRTLSHGVVNELKSECAE
jgi:hypothetical protein